MREKAWDGPGNERDEIFQPRPRPAHPWTGKAVFILLGGTFYGTAADQPAIIAEVEIVRT